MSVSAPLFARVTPGNNRLIFTWRAPPNTTGKTIADYILCLNSNGTSIDSVRIHSATAQAFVLTKTGLTNGTSYTYYLFTRFSDSTVSATYATLTATPNAQANYDFSSATMPQFSSLSAAYKLADDTNAVGGTAITRAGSAAYDNTVTYFTGSALKVSSSDATSGYAILPPSIITSSTGFTFSAWIYWRNISPGWQRIFDFFQTTFSSTGSTSNVADFVITNGAGTSYFDIGAKNIYVSNITTEIPLNTWTHVAVTAKKGGKMMYYINGVSKGSTSSTLTASIYETITSACTLYLGVDRYDKSTYFRGSMQNVAIWNAELTPAEIIHVYSYSNTVPDAPSGVTATTSGTSATVTFDMPLNATSYTVTSSPGNLTATGTSSPLTVTGLTLGTSYTFTVTATNGTGTSVASAPSNSVTPVLSAPTGVTATVSGSTATVSFTAVSGAAWYKVTSSPGGLTASGSSTSISVPGLTYGTSYTFTVQASDSSSSSYYSTASVASASVTPTLAAPTIQSVTAGNGSVTVSFTSVSNANWYKVTSSPAGFTASGGSSPLTVNGLTNGTAYTFTVQASDSSSSSYYSAASAASASVTPATNPDNPTVTVSKGNGRLMFSFAAPANTGGSAIASYSITNVSTNVTTTVTSPATLCTVSGLTNGTLYTYTAKATNAAGLTSAGVSVSGTPAKADYSYSASWTPQYNTSMIAAYSFNNTASESRYGTSSATLNGSSLPSYGTSQSYFNGSALQLAGGSTNQYANLAPVTLTNNNFTFAAWVYWGGGAGGDWQRVFDFGKDTSYYFFLSPKSTGSASNDCRVAIKQNAAEQLITLLPSPFSTNNTWYHTAVTVDAAAGRLNLYVNGVLVAYQTGITYALSSVLGSNMYIGKSQWNGDSYFIGAIQHVGLWNAALSASEIATLYTYTVPSQPPTFKSFTAVANTASKSVTLTWDVSANDSAITSYAVKRGGATVTTITTGITTPYTYTDSDSALVAGVSYEYSVVATNVVGPTTSSVVSVLVPAAPVVNGFSATAQADGSITLSWSTATSVGTPLRGYTLKRGDVDLSSNMSAAAVSYTDSGLTMGTSYVYKLIAKNDVGNSAEAQLTVTARTTPTFGAFTATPKLNGSIDLSWSILSNGGAAITGYTLSRGLTSLADPDVNAVSATDSDPSLMFGQNYVYNLSATNDAGTSIISASATPYTLPGAPVSLSFIPHDTSITVNCAPPAIIGGNLLVSYRVRVYDGATATTPIKEVMYTTLPVPITELTDGVNYYFKMAVMNNLVDQYGPDSAMSEAQTTVTVPSEPTNIQAVAGYNSISATWDVPDISGGNTAYTYEVLLVDTDGIEIRKTVSDISATLTVADDNLQLGMNYTVYVAAIGNIDTRTGAYGIVIDFCMPYSEPVVSDLTATVKPNKVIDLSWSIAENRGPLTSYTLTRNGTELTAPYIGNIYYTDSDSSLVVGDSYTYELVATNEGGSSTPVSVTVILKDAPVISNVTATPIANKTVSLSWNIDTNGADILEYTLERDGSLILADISTTATAFVDTDADLVFGQNYEYTLTARNVVGTITTTQTVSLVVPPAITNFAAAIGANKSIDLSWGISEYGNTITGYTLMRGTTELTGLSATDLSFVDADEALAYGTSYTYTLVALTDSALDSEPAEVTILLGGAPTLNNLQASVNANKSVTLTWDVSEDGVAVSSYVLTRGSDAIGSGSLIGSDRTYVDADSSLVLGTAYTYTLVAVNVAGSSAPVSVAATFPNVPTIGGFTATANADKTVSLMWDVSDGGSTLDGYALTRNGTPLTAPVLYASSYLDDSAGLAAGQQYTYALVASNAFGSSSSDVSASVTMFNVPSLSGFKATANVDRTITLDWSLNSVGSSVTSYTLTRNGTAITAPAAGVITYTDPSSSLVVGTTYVYRLIATNGIGSSSYVEISILYRYAPTLNTLTSTADLSTGVVTLSWSVDNGGDAITGYTLTRDGTLIYGPAANVTTFTDTPYVGSTRTYTLTPANLVGTGNTLSTAVLVPSTAGSVDYTYKIFPPSGFTSSPTSSSLSTPKCAVFQSDGKILVGGSFGAFNGIQCSTGIARLNADGTLDNTFNYNNAGVSGSSKTVNAIAIQTDGKIVIAGDFTAYNGVNRGCIARLNADGTHDATFNPGTGVVSYVINVLILQSTGKMLIGGSFTSYNSVNRNRVARINSDGSLDLGLDSSVGADAEVRAMAVDACGNILVGGSFVRYNGSMVNGIARITPTGSTDGTFSSGSGTTAGLGSNIGSDYISSIAIQSTGRILIGGYISSYNSNTNNTHFIRLTSTGAIDTTFNSTSTAKGFSPSSTGIVRSIVVLSDNKIVVGGDFSSYYTNNTTVSAVGIIRLTADGLVDGTFSSGTGASSTTQSITVRSDGNILLLGPTLYNGITRKGMVLINSAGTIVQTFMPHNGPVSGITAMVTQTDGKVVIGGNSALTRFGDTAINSIARVNIDGSLDASFNSGGAGVSGSDRAVYGLGLQSTGNIIVGGSFTAYNGTSRNNICRLNTNGTLDGTFASGTGANNIISVVKVLPDDKILIAGSFTTYNGTSTSTRFIRLNSTGSIDLSFNAPSIGSQIRSIDVQSDGKIIVGGTIWADGVIITKHSLVRLNIDGSIDTTFNSSGTGPGAGGYVYSVAVQPDDKILIGGDFTSYNGTNISRIARLNANGTLDTTFTPGTGANNTVSVISLQSDNTIIIGGSFTSYNGNTSAVRIARLSASGVFDSRFVSPNYPTANVGAVSFIQPTTDRKIIINGSSQAPFMYRLNATIGTPTINSLTAVGNDDKSCTISWSVADNMSAITSYVLKRGTTTLPSPDPTSTSYIDPSSSNLAYDVSYTYTLTATNSYGTSSTASFTVTMPNKPVLSAFTGTAVGKTVVLNWSVNTKLSALKYYTLTRNNEPIASPAIGVTTYTDLSSDVLTSGSSYTYRLIATNGVGDSNTATSAAVTIPYPPTVSAFTASYLTYNVGKVPTLSWSINNGGSAITSYTLTRNGDILTPPAVSATSFTDLTTNMIDGTVFTYTLVANNAVGPSVVASTTVAIPSKAGNLDYSFKSYKNTPNDTVRKILVQTDGKILLCGDFTNVAGYNYNRIVRLNADYTIDKTFNIGTGANDKIYSMVQQPDGKILAVGAFTTFNGYSKAYIVRLNTDGSVDDTGFISPTITGWASAQVQYINKVTYDTVNQRIIIAGGFTSINNNTRNRIACLVSYGALNVSFDVARITSPFTITASDTIVDVAAEPGGGTVFVVVNKNSSSPSFVAKLFTGTGNYYDSYTPYTGSATSLYYESFTGGTSYGAVGPTLSSYFPGDYYRVRTSSTNFVWMSYGTYGIRRWAGASPSVDTNFSADVVAGTINDLYPLSNGKYLVAGSPTSKNNPFYILNNNGSLDTTSMPNQGVNNSVTTTLVQPDNKIMIGGAFTSTVLSGITRNYIARVNADGTLDASFTNVSDTSGLSTTINKIVMQSDGKYIIAGKYARQQNVGAEYKFNLIRFTSTGEIDGSFNGTGAGLTSDEVKDCIIDSSGKILIGGQFTTYSGVSGRNYIARINSDGTYDGTFNVGTGTNTVVNSIAQQSDGKYLVGGNFISYNGTPITRIMRLNTNGSLDLSFNPGVGPDSAVSSVVPLANGTILIGGSFTSYNGESRSRIVRLNSDGSLDTTFINNTFNNKVNDIKVQADGSILVGGAFTSVNSVTYYNNIVRLLPNGMVDISFVGSGDNNEVKSISIASDNKIIVGGTFQKWDNKNSVGMARLYDATIDVPTIGNFVATANVDKTVNLSWYTSKNGGNLTAYTLTRSGTPIAPPAVNDTSYLDASSDVLNRDTPYTYTLTATSTLGSSSASVSVTIPSYPVISSFTGTGNTNGSVTLTWSINRKNSPLNYYILKRDGIEITPPTNLTATSMSYTDPSSNLAYGQTYNYSLLANNGVGDSSGASVNVTLPNYPVLNTFTATANNNKSVTLNWSVSINGSSITSYILTRNGTTITAPGIGVTTYTDSGLTGATLYTYVLIANNGVGASNSLTASATPPNQPTLSGFTIIPKVNKTVDLSWSVVDGGSAITSYTLTRSGTTLTAPTVSATSYTDSSVALAYGGSYTYTLRATNAVGSFDISGSTTLPNFPVVNTLVVVPNVDKTIDLSWTVTPNGSAITGYLLTRNGTTLDPPTIAATTYKDTSSSIAYGTQYTYALRAINDVGTGSATTTTITTPTVPTITGFTITPNVNKTVGFSWTIASNGNSIKSYTLKRDDEIIATPTNYANGAQTFTDSSASLVRGQTYRYALTATNEIGSTDVSGSATLPNFPSITNFVATPNTNKTVSFTWTAASNGSSITSYVLTRNGASITSPTTYTDGSRSFTDNSAALAYGSTYNYVLTATNGVGSTATTVMTVRLPNYPSFKTFTAVGNTATKSVTLTWDVSANDSNIVNYVVKRATGIATPTTTLSTITTSATSSTFTDSSSSLVAGSTYSYSITATNGVGATVSSTVNVVVPAVPTASSITPVANSDGTITVTWAAATSLGTPLTGYTLKRNDVTAGLITLFDLSASVTTFTDSGLRMGYQYLYQIIPKNGVGDGSAVTSVYIVARTTPTISSFTAKPNDTGSMGLTWDINNGGSVLTAYTLTRDKPIVTTLTPPGIFTTSATDSSTLTYGETYTYTLTATNVAGSTTVTTSAVASKLPDAPTSVSFISHDTGITVNFVPPSTTATMGGNMLIGYRVNMYTSAGATVPTRTETSATYPILINNLSDGVNYYFKVAVMNDLVPTKYGADSAMSAAQTTVAVPGAPSNVSVKAGYRKIDISWGAPSVSGGNTAYTYTVKCLRVDNNGEINRQVGSATSATFDESELEIGKTYQICVAAYGNIDTRIGAYSLPITVVPYSEPDAPVSLTAANITSTSFTISWAAPNVRGKPIQRYIVEENNIDINSNLSPSTPTLSLTGMIPNTLYTYKIYADNGVQDRDDLPRISAPTTLTVLTKAGVTTISRITGSARNVTVFVAPVPGISNYGIKVGDVALPASEVTVSGDSVSFTAASSLFSAQIKVYAITSAGDGVDSAMREVPLPMVAATDNQTNDQVIAAAISELVAANITTVPFSTPAAPEPIPLPIVQSANPTVIADKPFVAIQAPDLFRPVVAATFTDVESPAAMLTASADASENDINTIVYEQHALYGAQEFTRTVVFDVNETAQIPFVVKNKSVAANAASVTVSEAVNIKPTSKVVMAVEPITFTINSKPGAGTATGVAIDLRVIDTETTQFVKSGFQLTTEIEVPGESGSVDIWHYNDDSDLFEFMGKAIETAPGSGKFSFTFTKNIRNIATNTNPNGDKAVCFLGNAQVLTPRGYRSIDSLSVGDKVKTADGRTVKIQRVFVDEYVPSKRVNPYVIPAGQLGATEEVLVSPEHRIFVEGRGFLEAHKLGLEQRKMTEPFKYYNLGLPNWKTDNLVVSGIIAESLADVRRVVITMEQFAKLVKEKYGELTPAILAQLTRTCVFMPGGKVNIPVYNNKKA